MSFDGWKKVKLKDITTDGKGSYGIGAPAVEYNDELYTYLRITDITDDGEINKSELKSVNDEKAKEYILQKNDIVFARTGNSTGRSYLYNEKDGELVYAGFLIKFTLDESKVNPKYMKYYAISPEYRNWVNSFSTGSTRKNINAKMYGDMEINLPNRKYQDIVVELLEPLTNKILINEEINNTLEDIAKAIFKHWFIDFEFPNENGEPYKSNGGKFVESELGRIPKRWKNGKLGDLIRVQNGYAFKSKDFNDDGGVAVIKIKNISGGIVDINNTQFISKKIANKTDGKFFINGGDLLIAMTGAEVGKIGIVPQTDSILLLNQRVGKFVEQTPGGLAYVFNMVVQPSIQEQIKSLASGSAQPNISGKELESIATVISTSDILEKFSVIVNAIMEKIARNYEQNNKLAKLRDTLLPKLMSGEIRIPEVEQEVEACLQKTN